MQKDWLVLIAGGVVGVTAALFMLAYVANGIGQLRHGGEYVLPDSLVGLFQLILGGSITILTLGSIRAIKAPGRQLEKDKSNGEQSIETDKGSTTTG